MPPRTRSSISSLPATPSARSINSTSTTPRTTPRKVPRCTKCGNPRAGHPRSGCPFDVSKSPLRTKQEPDITNALSALNIEMQASDPDDKAALRARRVKMPAAPDASLASLSSTSSDVVNRLLKPGIMGDDTDKEDEAMVKRWQEAIVTPTKPSRESRARNYMPCTLDTPNSSFLSSQEGTVIIPEDMKHSSQNSTASIPSALSRTWSTEERTVFLDNLSRISTEPPATSFRFRSPSVSLIEQDAKRLGFHTRVIRDDEGVRLILGRSKEGVDALFREITRGTGEDAGQTSGQGTAFAGGAVVGAVATFTGLAFS